MAQQFYEVPAEEEETVTHCETIEELLDNCSGATDAKYVKQREGWTDRQGQKHMVEYVEWHYVADLLDALVPSWGHKVVSVYQLGDIFAVTASITIFGVTREGVGTGDVMKGEMGLKKAESDALKRAAVKFGIARDLYQKEENVMEKAYSNSAPGPGGFPSDPLAKSMADATTPKQLGMIRALAREAGVDEEVECMAVMQCGTADLSKRGASSLIDHLKALGAGGQAAKRDDRPAVPFGRPAPANNPAPRAPQQPQAPPQRSAAVRPSLPGAVRRS